MSTRLVALDEGPDIQLDRAMLVVGRHPQCDARLDSIRISRRHCCMMTHDNGEVEVRDLGSTNGIRVNGQRVEMGRLRPGDELAIAHIRYRLEDGHGHDRTLAESLTSSNGHHKPFSIVPPPNAAALASKNEDNPLAAAVREMLPSAVADRCRIQVIVQMPGDSKDAASRLAAASAGAILSKSSQGHDSCQPVSSP